MAGNDVPIDAEVEGTRFTIWDTVPGASKWQKSSLRGKFPSLVVFLIDNFWKFLNS